MRNRIFLRLGLTAALAFGFSANALDSGPKVIGCDFKFGKSEGTEKCLIVGSGMNQGIEWVVFEINKKRFRYENSSPNQIELINRAGKRIKMHGVKNDRQQCRPGGVDADVYLFENGDRICLYW